MKKNKNKTCVNCKCFTCKNACKECEGCKVKNNLRNYKKICIDTNMDVLVLK